MKIIYKSLILLLINVALFCQEINKESDFYYSIPSIAKIMKGKWKQENCNLTYLKFTDDSIYYYYGNTMKDKGSYKLLPIDSLENLKDDKYLVNIINGTIKQTPIIIVASFTEEDNGIILDINKKKIVILWMNLGKEIIFSKVDDN